MTTGLIPCCWKTAQARIKLSLSRGRDNPYCWKRSTLATIPSNTPGAGKVLVVDGQGSLESALMGDMIAAAAVANGWEGVIIHGAVRDSVALGEMDLGVKALGTNPRKSAKDGVGARGGVVSFGGADFAPGATVWADPDGILVTRA